MVFRLPILLYNLGRRQCKDQIVIDMLKRDEAHGQKLNEALRTGAYNVIHYAGHGSFDGDEPDRSALLLLSVHMT